MADGVGDVHTGYRSLEEQVAARKLLRRNDVGDLLFDSGHGDAVSAFPGESTNLASIQKNRSACSRMGDRVLPYFPGSSIHLARRFTGVSPSLYIRAPPR